MYTDENESEVKRMDIQTVFAQLPTLETERLLLRPITLTDMHEMFLYGSDAEVAKYVTWERHETLEDTRAFIQFVRTKYASGDVAPWGIELKSSGRLIGTIDFVSWQLAHKTAEIGYVISRDDWGQGMMTEAANRLVSFGFEEMALVRIQARCFAANIGSARVMEKIGMRLEGTMRKSLFVKGAHQDIHLYALLRQERDE